MTAPSSHSNRKGFLLLEVLLGFSVFAIAATGIIVALQRMAELSHTITEQQRITQISNHIFLDVLHTPTEGNDFTRDEIQHIDATTEAHILCEAYSPEDKDGNLLDNFYRVTVTIRSNQDGNILEDTSSTLHNTALFQSQ